MQGIIIFRSLQLIFHLRVFSISALKAHVHPFPVTKKREGKKENCGQHPSLFQKPGTIYCLSARACSALSMFPISHTPRSVVLSSSRSKNYSSVQIKAFPSFFMLNQPLEPTKVSPSCPRQQSPR